MDTMIEDVTSLATSAGRMVGTPGHAAARAYLVGRLAKLGLQPYGARHDSFELPYTVQGQDLVNVIGVVPGTRPKLDPIVLAAHYDTCGPLPGADDNAAAIAIALHVAARLRGRPTERSVVVALFDGEEPPYCFTPAMGSIHWYRQQRETPVHCAIVLDLVGHDLEVPGLEDLLFVMGMESDPNLVMSELDRPGLRVQPVLNRYVGDLSDHHVFRVHERPFLFLSCGRWTHYHARTDTPDRLNFDKMRAIASLVESLARRVDAVELCGPFGEAETLAIELAGIERNFAGLLTRMGHRARMRERADVDAFVSMAINGLGL
jgi:hypothetical protein